jgi:hypothetical protein
MNFQLLSGRYYMFRFRFHSFHSLCCRGQNYISRHHHVPRFSERSIQERFPIYWTFLRIITIEIFPFIYILLSFLSIQLFVLHLILIVYYPLTSVVHNTCFHKINDLMCEAYMWYLGYDGMWKETFDKMWLFFSWTYLWANTDIH